MYQEIIDGLDSCKFVQSYKVLEYFADENVNLIKIKAHLVDGSILFIREFIKINVSHYSYHWQDTVGKLRLRWDNAPHHPEIATFPHHLHQENTIAAAFRSNIKEVLEKIEPYLNLLL